MFNILFVVGGRSEYSIQQGSKQYNSNLTTMKKVFIILFAIVPALAGYSQDKKEENEKEKEKKFGISFSGYVKSDFFYDSRQVVCAREGDFLFWPAPEKLDVNDEDINAKASFNFLSVQSRLSGKISGPDALGAKTSGLIEGDFFAQANANINLFRLRHAFVKFNWKTTELLGGQYWNPLFVTGCFPGTVSFNTGTPLQSFARNPQIRLTQNAGEFKFIFALLSQRDYATWDNKGSFSSSYLRNSGVPDLHFQVHYEKMNKERGTGFLVGAGIAYKTVVPRLESKLNDTVTYKVDEKVSGITAIGFAKVKLNPVTIKIQGRYGENISDLLTISGYALKEVKDPVTGESTYTPLKNIAFWGDIHTNGEKWQVGVFGGYTKNLGTKEAMSEEALSDLDNNIYGFGRGIESVFRISPRVMYNVNQIRLAMELEYTSASFADAGSYDVNYISSSTTTVANIRTLLSIYYFF